MNDPAAPAAANRKRPRLRHPFEIPTYIAMVVLNVMIVAFLLVVAIIELVPTRFGALVIVSTPLREAVGWAAIVILVLGLVMVVGRQLNRAATRGNSVLAGADEFPEVAAIKKEAASSLGIPPAREPEIYVTAGNGVLNAFAASTPFHPGFVVVYSDLFANTLEQNQRALRFIVGHEMGHIRLHHTRVWYQLSIALSSLVPFLGAYLSRLRELSCDRHGAWFEPAGADGLVLLTAGRYIYRQVTLPALIAQARRNVGFWNTVVQLPLSHPLTLRRIRELNRLGLIYRSTGAPAGRGEAGLVRGDKPQTT